MVAERKQRTVVMKSIIKSSNKTILALSAVALSIMAASGPADAAGCLKGAIVGGAVGHYTAHHGLLGAAAGCLIGRHEAAKHEREQVRQPGGSDDRNAVQYR
jgi:outer membrane lipoprotein SlyB